MGNIPGGMGGPGGPGGGDKKKQDKSKKKGPAPPPAHFGRRKKRVNKGPPGMSKIPTVVPTSKCRLRMLKLDRIKDYLLMEEEFINRQEAMKVGGEDRTEEERNKVDEIRGKPISVGNLEELIDDSHAIVSTSNGPEFYVNILSIVDQDQLEPGSSVLLHNKSMSIVGILADDVDPLVSVMKVDKAPLESYSDIGGLEQQIQEIKEAVELPLTHPELYEDIGIKPPKGVILYGAPGTGKTLLAKAVANETSATFLRVVGSELIQKYLGDGPKLVREMFRVANEQAPSIVFIDEIDAVGTKRYDTTSGGEREIQRTMLELLNQLDGFDQSADVKVILATNKIESLDPALLRPGRIDRKIEFPLPDINTKRRIFQIHTSKMTLADDVDLEEFVHSKDDLSGADIKAICTEAGMLALRERRMRVTAEDLRKAREKALYRKKGNIPEGMYL
ncbi:26S protease regulatory subunit, putative [Perkinsus marinus ATCC 50983]|uniref:26S proteasome regulatory subunit 4 homolog n=1 Tax=Perkinsus marinus (strain ATCC 50983 / TXsc) TaxID=423536 RepID=C5KJX4_PERM5|nr:26S protease regulatory subunit, putative [Perkinsus marinus ATCC 50983]XP_002783436.1 26S protease regulatory subunit, putative [Perkinsus marinus ATCC 50983]EER09875.1 26S protease regulatory subunit, putative [Perkinsus marinus ATCC 50983]EER15232.1 26S protease regulatory subunit, putative [Perkinsus marinus ATCC 50983]|eukprot:XP_002778080.1 26S protease regulatory subunit, putative [Perkinsus marinus ATCC 50983]